jgi:hypothetical protein
MDPAVDDWMTLLCNDVILRMGPIIDRKVGYNVHGILKRPHEIAFDNLHGDCIAHRHVSIVRNHEVTVRCNVLFVPNGRVHETQRQRYTNSDKVVAHRVCIIRNYSNCGSQLSASPTLYPPLFIWYPLLFTITAMAYHGLSACCIVCGAFGFSAKLC